MTGNKQNNDLFSFLSFLFFFPLIEDWEQEKHLLAF